MSFVWSRVGAIFKKEVYHVRRDPFTMVLSLALPVFMVFMFGFAIEFNVKNIPLAVQDADQSQMSRRLIEAFGSSAYFIVDKVASPNATYIELLGNKARAALLIPGHFQRDLLFGRKTTTQILLDGSDNSTVGPILSYVSSIEQMVNKRLADFEVPKGVNLKTRFLFNPELNSRWFVIPGLCVVVMAILSVLLTALTVSREWEQGSMELMLSTPVSAAEIVVGKLLPYGILGIIAVSLIYVLSRTIFGIPFEGNLLVFALGCIAFLISCLAQGLLISVIVRSQQVAVQLAITSGLLPAQLLSGFIFPVESMPTFFRYLTMLLPARWFMNISRQSYLKGSTMLEMSIPFIALVTLGSMMVFLAVKKFKMDLEP
jgi:drug efflux transport system permease protein